MLWFIPLVTNDCNRKASHYQKQCFCCTHPRIPQHDADSIEDQQEVRLLDNTSSCLENSNQVRVEEKVCTLQKLFNIIFFESVEYNKRSKLPNCAMSLRKNTAWRNCTPCRTINTLKNAIGLTNLDVNSRWGVSRNV